MPRLKQIVKRTEIEVAKAKRTCKFTSEPILKGSLCLVVYDGPRNRSCYSREIAIEMIKLARMKLDELESCLLETQST